MKTNREYLLLLIALLFFIATAAVTINYYAEVMVKDYRTAATQNRNLLQEAGK